jgi:hypothetical protein
MSISESCAHVSKTPNQAANSSKSICKMVIYIFVLHGRLTRNSSNDRMEHKHSNFLKLHLFDVPLDVHITIRLTR